MGEMTTPEDTTGTLEAYIEEQFEAALRPMEAHLDAALTNLDRLGDLARRRCGSAQRATWAYHHTYLRERLQDVRIIVGRMVEAKREFARLQAEQAPRREQGGDLDPRILTLPVQMKLDFESLYIFGNLALDQWVMLVSALTGEPTGDRPDFHRLVMMLQATEYAGMLLPAWERHRNDIVWLYYHVRSVRNHFVEHLRTPLQRSQVLTFYGADFELFMPAMPSGDGNRPSIGDAAETLIRQLGRQHVTHVPSEEWDEYGFPYVLQLVFHSIDALGTQVEREQVWEAWQRLGGTLPSYHIVALRLGRFLDESLCTVIEIIGAPPDAPNLT